MAGLLRVNIIVMLELIDILIERIFLFIERLIIAFFNLSIVKAIDQAIIKCLSIALFVFTWTHFSITNNVYVFYPLLAVCCFLFYSGMVLPVKYRDFDFRVNLVGFLFTFSNLLDEFLFDPKKIQLNEYVFAVITLIFVIRGRANKKENSKHLE